MSNLGQRRSSSFPSESRGTPEVAFFPTMAALAVGLLLAGLFWAQGHRSCATGLVIGALAGTVHVLSWAFMVESIGRGKAFRDVRFIGGLLVKAALVYAPVFWLIGQPPLLGVFAAVGFSMVLSVLFLLRRRIRRPEFGMVVGLFLFLSAVAGQGAAWASTGPSGTRGIASRGSSPQAVVHPVSPSDRSSKQQVEKAAKKERPDVELPTIGRWVEHLFPESTLAHWLGNPHVERVLWTFLVTIGFALLMVWVARHAALHPGRLQSAVELGIKWVIDLMGTILPEEEARKFLPFSGGLFLYILVVNMSGLIPFSNPGTTFIAMTAGLAVCVFLVVQYVAFRRLGPLGYLYHLAGEPVDGITWALSPLMLLLHLIEEITKPITLAVRLFGNVFAEHTLLGIMTLLGLTLVAFAHSPVGIPLDLPFMFLGLLTGAVQALVFGVLSAVYIALVLPHEEQ